MQYECVEMLYVLVTFPARQPGDHLPTRPESTATAVYLNAGLGQSSKKKKNPSLLGGTALHQLCLLREAVSSIAN